MCGALWPRLRPRGTGAKRPGGVCGICHVSHVGRMQLGSRQRAWPPGWGYGFGFGFGLGLGSGLGCVPTPLPLPALGRAGGAAEVERGSELDR